MVTDQNSNKYAEGTSTQPAAGSLQAQFNRLRLVRLALHTKISCVDTEVQAGA